MNLHVNLIFFQLNKTVNQIVTYQTPYMRYVLYDIGISAVLYALSFFDCQKKQILFIQSCLLTLWQYGLWSFQTGGTKSERFLPKNQHTQRQ
jgi:hypothetical protein